MIQESGFILFLDLHKAFDSAENPFILQILKHFGFGENFLDEIGVLCNGVNSSGILGHGAC